MNGCDCGGCDSCLDAQGHTPCPMCGERLGCECEEPGRANQEMEAIEALRQAGAPEEMASLLCFVHEEQTGIPTPGSEKWREKMVRKGHLK